MVALTPTLPPFHQLVRLEQLLVESIWRTYIKRASFGVNVIASNDSTSAKSQSLQKINSRMAVKGGEGEVLLGGTLR